ncbi:accessory gene regulator ArgB-like protein [Desulfitibacter alkalitolerans]|uniref:accessory gene regulator ArgB-like protein n=1 Tax=Desulfitibacter alkalitolerans TaxID=264641 RepID=UPI00047F2487|nr:accessory gene regulator B family protein [Desulfitibacter alkalitolerans]
MSGYIKKVSCFIQNELNLSDERREVIAYGMETLVSTLLGLFGIVLFGYLFDLLVPALIISLTALATRVYTGGAHCSSMGRCTIATIIIFMVLAYISTSLLKPSLILIAGGYITSIIFIVRYAPAEVKEKPLSETHKKELKKGAHRLGIIIGLLTILIYFLVKEEIVLHIIGGFLWQTFTITPLGFTIIRYFDDFLKLFMKGDEKHEKT